jgi:Glucodextranase, domain B
VTTRRGGRPSQVRPRPPSTGRAAPPPARPRTPSPTRLTAHRRVERGPGIALPFRALLIVGVVALGLGVLMLATGGLGRVAASIGSSINGFVGTLTATPVPSKALDEAADSPVLTAPEEPYTRQASVDIIGTIPAAVAGDTAARIRLYVAIGDGSPGVVVDTPVGASQRFLFPSVELSQGLNTFSATIVSSANLESEPSASISYILDTSKPRIVISSPKNNAVVNAKTLKVTGQTQARSTISVRNASTNSTVSGSADGKGAFEVVVPLGTGTNTIQVTATDPAGNANTATVAVRRGTGALTARLAASDYQIKASTLPERVTLTVTVTDPDGKALKGAAVTFTLAVPGVPAIASGELTTGSNGRASFTTTIPKGATKGQTSVTVIVSTDNFGNTTDRTVITIN